MKAIIFDASTLITFAMNGLLEELKKLKEIFDGKFLITNEVKSEMIDKPLTIKRFELEALKLNKLLNLGVFEMPSSLGIKDSVISRETKKIINIANKTFRYNGKYVHALDLGETSCLALNKILNEKGIMNVVAVDERTMRMFCERPANLEKLFRKKLHTKITSKKENFNLFKGCKIIRSSELVYIIYKKGLMDIKHSKLLDALLYAVKYKGCSISWEEIDEIKSLK